MSKTYKGIPPVTVKSGIRRPGSSNATHNLMGIEIWAGIRHPAATLMQEIREWWYLRKRGALFALPVLIAAGVLLYLGLTDGNDSMILGGALAGFASVVVWLLGPRTRGSLQHMELMGHATECIVAVDYYGYELERVLMWETMALIHYDQFEGVDEDEIGERLLQESKKAQGWVDKNPKLVQKWVDRLPEIA